MIEKIEKYIGGFKFAVILILAFSAAMVVGTFVESYYGTEFAGRLIYKSWPFMLLQLLLFLSIALAALLRLPPKKRLYGFYTIHSGLIIIGAGSFVTYIAGVDGNMTLYPNEPSREIILNQDIFSIRYEAEGKVATYELPRTPFSSDIDVTYEDITLKSYLPFSENKFTWKTDPRGEDKTNSTHSGTYFIANEMVSQEFTLSLNPEASDFDSTLELGPLTIHYLPALLAPCFARDNNSEVVLWDAKELSCFTPEEKKLRIETTDSGKRFFAFKNGENILSFFPENSPWPLDEKLEPITNSNIRVFSKRLFKEKPNLFIFGPAVSYFDDGKWVHQNLTPNENIQLPWMGFELTMLKHATSEYPELIPYPTLPLHSGGKIVKGEQKAVKVLVKNREYWVTDSKPIALLINGRKVILQLKSKTLRLPFQISLSKFKMDKDPGTNNPASYESFVQLLTEDGPTDHHVFMNNPLKFAGFTFYQASYFPLDNGAHGSVLSANVDQGRPLKYFGSLLLVLGAIWHYNLNMRKKKPARESSIAVGAAT